MGRYGVPNKNHKWAAAMRLLPCHYCGKTPAGTIDHVQRRRHGGMATKENCVPACAKCNQDREWMPRPEGCYHPFLALAPLLEPKPIRLKPPNLRFVRPWYSFRLYQLSKLWRRFSKCLP